MKPRITVYTNLINYLFFEQVLSKYFVNFKPLEDLFTKNSSYQKALIVYNGNDEKAVDFNLISKNVLIFTNKDIKYKINNKRIKLINKIISPQSVVEEVEKNLFINNFKHKNILISDKRLKNIINDKSCYLTDIEKGILECLFLNNSTSRKYIKQNILNIKSSIETNSLDSHLTRIRKKFNQINAGLTIESKKDVIKIY